VDRGCGLAYARRPLESSWDFLFIVFRLTLADRSTRKYIQAAFNPGKQLSIERRINVRGPFRLATAINVLRRAENPPLLTHEPVRFQFSQEVPGGAVEVDIRQDAPGTDVFVSTLGDLADGPTMDMITNRIVRMFSLTVNADGFYSRAREDMHMLRVLAICPDLRPVLYPTAFEGVLTAVLSYRQSVRETASFIGGVREVAGVVPEGRPQAQAALPGKFTFLATPVKLLEMAGIPKEKILDLKRISAHLVGEPDLLERLDGIDDVSLARKALQHLPGINKSIALHLLQYAYGHSDLLLDSPMLRRAVKRFYHLSDMPDERTLLHLAKPYERWRSWWTFALLTANEMSVIA
jgi:DNA-3-methyladenine glycosylase II